MDQVTQANAASAEQSAEEAVQLSDQAGQLLSAVEGLGQLMHGHAASSPQRKKSTPGRRPLMLT